MTMRGGPTTRAISITSLPVGKLLQGPSVVTLAAWLYEEIEQAAKAIDLLSDEETEKLLLAGDGQKKRPDPPRSADLRDQAAHGGSNETPARHSDRAL
jgi:hypothetical protein